MRDLSELVKKSYSQPEVVKRYSIIELFPAEEKMISKYFKKGGKVLDVACGAGRTSIALAKKGFQVLGIDLVPEMITSAQKQAQLYQVQVDFMIMDATQMNFPGSSFQNVLFSFNGFEQIPGKKNREKILKNVYNVLKPGGCFIFTIRSGLAFGKRWLMWSGMILFYIFKEIFMKDDKKIEFGDKIWGGEYHHYLNPFQLKKRLERIGFSIELINSSKNILKHKKFYFWNNFSTDRMIFFVMQK